MYGYLITGYGISTEIRFLIKFWQENINGHKVTMHENLPKETELECRGEGIYGQGKRKTEAE